MGLRMMPANEQNGGRSDRVDQAVRRLQNQWGRADAPGASVLVLQGDEEVLGWSQGRADWEQGIGITLETNFRLASVTKQFTAMAVLLLAERGQLRLEDTLAEYFTELPAWGREIRVRHLLHHTSGLRDYEDLIPAGTTLPVFDLNVVQILQREGTTYFPPGTQFRYSNTAYAFLALLVQRVSGATFGRFLQHNIFGPLGMSGTVAYEPGISTVPRRAFGYSVGAAGEIERTDQSVTSAVLGDGGIYSSCRDLARWSRSWERGGLLGSDFRATALASGEQTKHAGGVEYGCGWYLSAERGWRKVWHSGNTIGFTTRIERFPAAGLTLILLTNRNEEPLAEVAKDLAALFLPESSNQ